MRADAAEALRQRIRSASAAQLSPHGVSGYRSYSYQVSVYASAIADQGTDVAEYEPCDLRWVDVTLATYLHDRHIPTLEQTFGPPAAPSY